RLACDFISKKGKERMPCAPLVLAHQALARPKLARDRAQNEEGKFCRGFRKYVCGIGERNLVTISVRAIDIVEADGELRHNFKLALARLKNLRVDRITKRGDQAVDAAGHLFHDDLLRRRLRTGIDFKLVVLLSQTVESRFTNVAGCVDALGHDVRL